MIERDVLSATSVGYRLPSRQQGRLKNPSQARTSRFTPETRVRSRRGNSSPSAEITANESFSRGWLNIGAIQPVGWLHFRVIAPVLPCLVEQPSENFAPVSRLHYTLSNRECPVYCKVANPRGGERGSPCV